MLNALVFFPALTLIQSMMRPLTLVLTGTKTLRILRILRNSLPLMLGVFLLTACSGSSSGPSGTAVDSAITSSEQVDMVAQEKRHKTMVENLEAQIQEVKNRNKKSLKLMKLQLEELRQDWDKKRDAGSDQARQWLDEIKTNLKKIELAEYAEEINQNLDRVGTEIEDEYIELRKKVKEKLQ